MEHLTVVFAVLLAMVSWLIKKNLYEPSQYWKESGIPYISLFCYPKSLYDMITNPVNEIILRNYKKYGRICGQFHLLTPFLVVAEPEIVKDILVKDFPVFVNRMTPPEIDPISDNVLSVLEGDHWKRVRTTVSPAFSTGKLKRMAGIIVDCAKTLGKNFESAAKVQKCVDTKRLFGAFLMDVIASTAFATKIDSHNDPDNAFVVAAKIGFTESTSIRALFSMVLSKYLRFLGYRTDFQKSMDFFKDATLQIIEERERTGQTRNDFLQLLIEAAEVTNQPTEQRESNQQNGNDHFGDEGSNAQRATGNYKGLNENELLAQCVIFFMAGYETTSSTLAFAAYSLAMNSDCQEKLIAEVDDVLRENGNQFTYEGVKDMKYLDAVVCETLRMYPPALALIREAGADYTVRDYNINLKKGCLVSVPVYAMHHDPEYFPDPEKFDPDRFTQEEKTKRNPYTYLPFGTGPRNCIAMRFALIVVKYCLAYLMSQFRFKPCQETQVPPQFSKGQMILTVKDIILGVEKRTDAFPVADFQVT